MPRPANKRGQGEGSIRQRKDGLWETRVTVGKKPDGKPDRRSLYGKTRAEVQRKLREALAALDCGTYVEPSKLTVGEWL